MKFEKFWKLLMENDNEFSLQTLVQNKEFTISKYSENSQIPTNSVLFVTPSSTKNQRHIQKSEFLKVWEEAKQITNPFSPSNYTLSTRNSSYIVTLMRHFVGSEKIE